MKNLAEIQTIVRDYVQDDAADVDQHIFDAINFLSSIFGLSKIQDSQVTIAGNRVISYPDNCIRVKKLKINDEWISELIDLDHLENAEANEIMRWYGSNGWSDSSGDYIQLTEKMANDDEMIEIWYDQYYKMPEAAVDTDVPQKFMELVYVGATYRYFRRIVTDIMLHRTTYPDVTPDEARLVRRQWHNEFYNLLKITRQNEKHNF